MAAYLFPGPRALLRASPTFFEDLETLPAAREIFDRHQATRVAGLRALLEEARASGRHPDIDPRYLAELTFEVSKIARRKDVQARSGMSIEEWHGGLFRMLHLLLREDRGNG
ncbi:hypothetical protein [Sulfitobacter sp. MOLA879]|uniref:hypothetical protein n=1 Tax=Sulfitobacter sp. MOLA879 TaxID=3368579 RepID=UPI0037489CB4